MCVLTDSRLCGNFMFRRAFNRITFNSMLDNSVGSTLVPLAFLARSLDSNGYMHDFIKFCEDAVDKICPRMFTVHYHMWAADRKELCGEPSTNLVSLPDNIIETPADALNKQLRSVEFGSYLKIVDVQMDSQFLAFMVLMMIVWSLSCWPEVVLIAQWWRVFVGVLEETTIFEAASEQERTVTAGSISLKHRRFIVMTLCVRTVICSCTIGLGSVWLARSGSYNELILNTLAMGFVLNLDEILFAAVVPLSRKK
eukprot:UN0285